MAVTGVIGLVLWTDPRKITALPEVVAPEVGVATAAVAESPAKTADVDTIVSPVSTSVRLVDRIGVSPPSISMRIGRSAVAG
ncbi:MAG: hypothetical protein B7Z55_06000 [Planctomycetales bacterium 12-60-4]|nr:MAG: hypothetical protein B7Z55_06000 [Planctomycetales bacterium 12-60-4]